LKVVVKNDIAQFAPIVAGQPTAGEAEHILLTVGIRRATVPSVDLFLFILPNLMSTI